MIVGERERGRRGAGGAACGDERAAPSELIAALVRFEAERAREWFDRGIALTAMLDRRSAACVLAMAGIYRRLLERIEQRPEEALRRRMSLPAREKAWVAARRPAPDGDDAGWSAERRARVVDRRRRPRRHRRGARLRRGGRERDARRGPPQARRRGLLLRARRPALDNGQHVFLRCCHAYRALLARLGSERLTSVQPRLEIPVLKPGARPALLRRGSLPAPLQLAGALARYPHLTLAERLGAARAALGLLRLNLEDPALEAQTFGDWLARHGQGPRAVAALWDLIALPTLNLPAAQASLALAAFVFRTGLLSAADAGDIGFHDATLGETIGEPAARALREAGVRYGSGWRAERLAKTADGVEVHGRGARRASDARAEEASELRA